MKKWIGAGLVMLCLLALCGLACAETTTLLMYVCGADMQDAACEDIFEIAEVEAGEDITLVLLAGGAEEWDIEDFAGGTRTYAAIRDGYFMDDPEDWGRGSMGNPLCLEDFLVYGMTQYPADRYILILWNHGAGAEGGLCFDETADDDGLTLVEIDEALTAVGQRMPGYHINILGCDACMMASYEMAAMLSRHSVGYFVASEELEPGTGWYYTGWLEMLADDPGISDEDLCRAIVDTFMEDGLMYEPDDYLTMSAIDLSKVGALTESMEAFAAVLSGELSAGNLSAVRRGRSRLYTFGSFDDGSWDMVDLGAALDAYAQFDPALAAEAKRCLEAAVVACAQTDNLDPCSGLAVLIPQDTTDDFDEYREGFELVGVIPNWVNFVTGYSEKLRGGDYHITAAAASPISSAPADTFSGDVFYSAYSSPIGFLHWDDESQTYGDDVDYGDIIEITDGADGFTAMLPPEDLDYLDYVEGMLLMDISDDEGECYVDFGLMRNNLVDWKTGRVVSLFDGTWPIFGGQPVPLYDQTSNEHSRRSLLPVKLNGEYTYLVVVFPAGGTEGRIIGANAGYDDSGLPIRTVTKLKPGDEIVPVYTLLVEVDGQDELEEEEYEGDPVIWEDGMTVTYEYLGDDDDPAEMLFCFVFNDIFGEYTMSEMVAFEM